MLFKHTFHPAKQLRIAVSWRPWLPVLRLMLSTSHLMARDIFKCHWPAFSGSRIKSVMKRYSRLWNIQLIPGCLFFSILIAFSLFTAGCSVSPPPPTHYFLLESPKPPTKIQVGSPKYPVRINLAEIVLIPPYDSENLVVRLGHGEIQFYNYKKWAAPPATMIRNYLNKTFLYNNRFHISDRRIRTGNSLLLRLEFQELAHNREKQNHSSSMVVFASLSENSSSGYNWYKLYSIRVLTNSNQVPDIIKAFNSAIKQLSNSLLKDIDLYLTNQQLK